MTAVNYTQLIQLRHELHANPEVSGNELGTANQIIQFLKTCKPDELLTEIGGQGIIASWFSGTSGNEILLRAELDALPIEEINNFTYKSKVSGVSHKCGHDGHSTILCGIAQMLAANSLQRGTVHLLFQPAEETGEGAKAMLEDNKCKHLQPDYVFALHNLAGYPLHTVVVKDHAFTAAVNSMVINLTGKTAHAAEPEQGINPALAVADILQQSLLLANNKPDAEDMRVITPVCVELGEKAYGVAAGQASVHLTLRCWNNENLRKLEKQIEELCQKIATLYGLTIAFKYTQTFFANINHTTAANIVRKVAALNKYAITEKEYPFKWGEDFGLFTSRFKGCMFGLGAGEMLPALHNPDYDFPDELIETGVTLFWGIINEALSIK